MVEIPSYIEILPPELLSQIFTLCQPEGLSISLPDPRHPPLLLCHVCSSWRYIALSEPRLWHSLTLLVDQKRVKEDPTYDLSSIPQRFQSQALLWLDHTGGIGLSLSADLFWLSFDSFKMHPKKLRLHMDKFEKEAQAMWRSFVTSILIDHACRFSKLRLVFDNDQYLIPLFANGDADAFSQLESVVLKGHKLAFTPSQDAGALGRAPKLQRVVILLKNLPRFYAGLPVNFLPWTQLTHLMISTPCASQIWKEILKRCELLRECLMNVDDDLLDDGSGEQVIQPSEWLGRASQHSQMITLPHLTYLDIAFHSGNSTNFFEELLFPSLTRFALRSNVDAPGFMWLQGSASQSHLFDQLRGLHSLTLAYQYMNTATLIELLDRTIGLEELTVDSYLGDYSHFFQSLTCNPKDTTSTSTSRVRLPKLRVFNLYLEGNGDVPISSFRGEEFVNMITSRLAPRSEQGDPTGHPEGANSPSSGQHKPSVDFLTKVTLCVDDYRAVDLAKIYDFQNQLVDGGGTFSSIVCECDPSKWLPQEAGLASWD